MNKFIKYSLLGAVFVLGVALAGIVYLVMTFNPDDYKQQAIQAVKQRMQRNLLLDGEIKLSFFPNIGANVSKVSLSEFNGDKEFAAMESMRVSLALLPLLRQKIVVNEVAVNGLQATLIKHKDGTTNIDDLLGNDKNKTSDSADSSNQPLQFDIAAVSITNTHLGYQDEVTGAQYEIKNLSLKTGRIVSDVPSNVELAMGLQADQPKLDVTTQLKTKLTFNLDKQQYQFQDLDFKLDGSVLDMNNLKIQAKGDVSANLATGEYGAQRFTLNAKGNQAKNAFDATLNVPTLSMMNDKYAGEKITLNANLQSTLGNIIATLAAPMLEGNAQSFNVAGLTLEIDVKQPEQAFTIKSSTQLTGNFKEQQFGLSKLNVAINAAGDSLPNKSISSEMQGEVRLDNAKQSVRVNLSGGLLQSQINAKIGINNFTRPAIKFDIELDKLDADMYLPKPVATETAKVPVQESPLDLSGLTKLDLDGSLRIGTLKIMNVTSNQLRVDVKAQNGIVSVNPLSANLYQGSMTGSLIVNAQAIPGIEIKQNLSGINIATLGKDAADFDTLEGRGDVGVSLNLQGQTVSELKKSANGSLSLNLADGAIKGINLAKKIRDTKIALGAKSQSQSVNKEEKTDFSELKASFKVTNGVAHNDDLSMKSPLLRLSGNGDVNIGSDSINYLAKATLAKTLEGQGGKDAVSGLTIPVRVSGPYTNLKYTLDFAAMVNDETKQKVAAVKEEVKQKIEVKKEEVKQRVEEKKDEIKTQVQDQLKDRLKGLFK